MSAFGEGFRHRTVNVGDLSMSYVRGGTGEPLVMVHGFPQHSHMWHQVAPRLADQFDLILPDQRGLGGTTVARSGYDKRTLALDLAGLLDSLGIGQINLVGYDLGGGTALAFAYEFPDRVKKLAILEYAPPGFGFEYGFQPSRDWQSWQLSFFTQPDVAVRFLQGQERELLSWYFWHWSANPTAVSQADFEIYVRELSKPGGLRGGFEHFAAVFDDQALFAEYTKTKLAMPTLGIGGRRAAAEYVSQAIGALATHAQSAVIEDAGHWLADEQPVELADRLREFFTG